MMISKQLNRYTSNWSSKYLYKRISISLFPNIFINKQNASEKVLLFYFKSFSTRLRIGNTPGSIMFIRFLFPIKCSYGYGIGVLLFHQSAIESPILQPLIKKWNGLFRDDGIRFQNMIFLLCICSTKQYFATIIECGIVHFISLWTTFVTFYMVRNVYSQL